jgi:hypothetical protein
LPQLVVFVGQPSDESMVVIINTPGAFGGVYSRLQVDRIGAIYGVREDVGSVLKPLLKELLFLMRGIPG